MRRAEESPLIDTSSDGSSNTPVAVSRKSPNMLWRQFKLLTWKNFILLTRNKLWTFFELLMPILLSAPVFYFVIQSAEVHIVPSLSFTPTNISGSSTDVFQKVGFTTRPYNQWCQRDQVKLAYGSLSPEVDDFMKKVAARYKNSEFEVLLEKFESLDILKETLKNDLPSQRTTFCPFKEYIGGIWFEELNSKDKSLSYAMLLPNKLSDVPIYWDMDDDWSEMYGQNSDFASIPTAPPYWSMGLLTFQMAIDSEFIDNVPGSTSKKNDHKLQLLRLSESEYTADTLATFLTFIPLFWSIMALLSVLHAAKDVAFEKTVLKDFLSVMGLSTPVFYLTHILWAWLKILVVFAFGAVVLAINLRFVDMSLFLITVALYGLGAVVFGVLIASMFKTTSNAIKVTILAWVLSIGLTYVKEPKAEERLLSFLWSLNINGAFKKTVEAMADFQNRQTLLSWTNMFNDEHVMFTMGDSLIMLFVDVIWMILATGLMDQLFGDNELAWFFTSGATADYTDSARRPSDTSSDESDAGLLESTAMMKLENLSKTWRATGERAVENLNLSTYQGQVTVLLGHNGAGKSTTFSMICGLVKPTDGNVTICNEKVDFHSSRRNIGLCPQSNPLYEKLTVMEHLQLVHGLKGATSNCNVEATALLKDLKLTEKEQTLSMNLSGGMKRKLCVCMAVIGESPVVLLDEPTAGMDPGARRDVETLLQRIKEDRSILLTTHYMDEAEVLGDRVAIMAKGRIACVGSTEKLKKDYGVGYVMTVVIADKFDSNRTTQRVIEIADKLGLHVKQQKQHGSQVEFILIKEEQKLFPSFFAELEREQKNLGISSYGLSLTTLEQVFLKVGELSDPHAQTEDRTDLYKKLIQSQKFDRSTGCSLFWNQVLAIFMKRFLYSTRHWLQLFVQFFVPVGILCLVGYVSTWQVSAEADHQRDLSLSNLGPARVLLQNNGNSDFARLYQDTVSSFSNVKLENVARNGELTNFIVNLPKDHPAPAIGAIFGDNLSQILFSGRAYHSLPTSLNLLNNVRLRTATPELSGSVNIKIITYNSPTVQSLPQELHNGIINNVLGPLLVLALALLTSTVIMFLVEERVTRFGHQQSLTGVSPAVFWSVSFAYDFILYLLACTVFTIIFVCFGWMQNYMIHVFLIWLLYFWACMPFVYTVSFFFNSPAKANILLIVWQIVAVFMALILMTLLKVIPGIAPSEWVMEIIRSVLLFALPSFALGNGLMTLATFAMTPYNPDVLNWDNLGKNYVFMFLFGCLSCTLFLACQFKTVRYQLARLWDWRHCHSDVSDSSTPMANDVESQRNEEGTPALLVEKLTKYYGKLCALNQLSIKVDNGECFGLLGVNGAGKTTTFDILTGQSFPTSGSAKIDNKDVSEQLAIGYCPQFDAMMMDLTGRETLLILARLFGFRDAQEKANIVLEAVGMSEQADKLVRFYSGGQRRKMSVGLALMASTRMVILDEPTAGIDPKARRDIWDALTAVRNEKKSAIMLTSHSMDECEALCNKVAILAKGKLVAEDTCQQLKTAYGNSYTLTMVAPNKESKTKIMEEVAKSFEATLKSNQKSSSLTMKWQVTKHDTDTWSTIFDKCAKLAESLEATDFCLAQSSLEEAFLNLSEESEH